MRTLAVWMLASSILAGCGTAHTASGPRVDLQRETTDGRLIRYQLDARGTLRFAGGLDVRTESWSWEGAMPAGQVDQIQAIMARAPWMRSSPADVEASGDLWIVRAREGARHCRFEVHGDIPSVVEIWDVLEEAGAARLQDDLDRIPRPDIERYMQRRAIEHGGES